MTRKRSPVAALDVELVLVDGRVLGRHLVTGEEHEGTDVDEVIRWLCRRH